MHKLGEAGKKLPRFRKPAICNAAAEKGTMCVLRIHSLGAMPYGSRALLTLPISDFKGHTVMYIKRGANNSGIS
jgi:hypothetical protein